MGAAKEAATKIQSRMDGVVKLDFLHMGYMRKVKTSIMET